MLGVPASLLAAPSRDPLDPTTQLQTTADKGIGRAELGFSEQNHTEGGGWLG